MNKAFHVHLVSDATGETLNAIAKAALAQFEGVHVEEHSYVLVRSSKQLERVMEHLKAEPGLVFFTLVNQELRRELIANCTQMNMPCLDVMDGPIGMMLAPWDRTERIATGLGAQVGIAVVMILLAIVVERKRPRPSESRRRRRSTTRTCRCG